MAVHDNNRVPYAEVLGTNDSRTLKFYNDFLCSPHQRIYPQMRECAEDSSPEAIKNALHDYLRKHFPDEESGKKINEALINARYRGLLSLDRFDWLKKDEHACLYVYMALPKPYDPLLTGNPNQTNSTTGTPRNACAHSERYNHIRQIFDDPDQLQSTVGKGTVLEAIKSSYTTACQTVREYTWLTEKNEQAITWGWDYLRDYHAREQKKHSELSQLTSYGLSFQGHFQNDQEVGIPAVGLFAPVNTHETYLAIYCALRMWSCHPAEKTLFMRNFSKAWRQRVARQKEDQKAINAFVSIDTKTKLDELRKTYKMSIGEVLALLIENEYKILQHSSGKTN